ncbi:MAG: hypothetical protein QM711_07595 [Micropruina sp.]|uniref:hypothetical protein n=1 Tax=Micropruina sp. TaxID=2737536 RepID=UPI0039E430A3
MRTRSQSGAKLAALRAAIDDGCADLAAGRYVEIDDDQLDHYLAALGNATNSTPHIAPVDVDRDGD